MSESRLVIDLWMPEEPERLATVAPPLLLLPRGAAVPEGLPPNTMALRLTDDGVEFLDVQGGTGRGVGFGDTYAWRGCRVRVRAPRASEAIDATIGEYPGGSPLPYLECTCVRSGTIARRRIHTLDDRAGSLAGGPRTRWTIGRPTSRPEDAPDIVIGEANIGISKRHLEVQRDPTSVTGWSVRLTAGDRVARLDGVPLALDELRPLGSDGRLEIDGLDGDGAVVETHVLVFQDPTGALDAAASRFRRSTKPTERLADGGSAAVATGERPPDAAAIPRLPSEPTSAPPAAVGNGVSNRTDADGSAPPRPRATRSGRPSFSDSAVFLILVLILVLSGAWLVAPGLLRAIVG